MVQCERDVRNILIIDQITRRVRRTILSLGDEPIDSLYIMHHRDDTAGEDEETCDDRQSTDAVEPNEDVYTVKIQLISPRCVRQEEKGEISQARGGSIAN